MERKQQAQMSQKKLRGAVAGEWAKKSKRRNGVLNSVRTLLPSSL